MQTQKMSLANIKGKLSKAEMKNIMAGSSTYTGCVCTGGATGAWYYTSTPSCFQLTQDKYNYCRSHTALCNVACHV